jgi:hypothetical protein
MNRATSGWLRLWLLMLVLPAAGLLPAQQSKPASSPADDEEEPASASAPAQVKWADSYEAAKAQALQRQAPLVVIFLAENVPASMGLESRVISDAQVRDLLVEMAAVKLDAASEAGKALFEATGQKQPPLTQIFHAQGPGNLELLDAIPGAAPVDLYRRHLQAAKTYVALARQEKPSPQVRWEMALSRLVLSTREKTLPVLDELAKNPPPGVPPERIKLAKAQAIAAKDPAAAKKLAQEVLQSAADKEELGGQAMLFLARQAAVEKDNKTALELANKYIAAFPAGGDLAQAYYDKAILLFGGGDRPAAVAALNEYMQNHRDDPASGKVRDLLADLTGGKRLPPPGSASRPGIAAPTATSSAP